VKDLIVNLGIKSTRWS